MSVSPLDARWRLDSESERSIWAVSDDEDEKDMYLGTLTGIDPETECWLVKHMVACHNWALDNITGRDNYGGCKQPIPYRSPESLGFSNGKRPRKRPRRPDGAPGFP